MYIIENPWLVDSGTSKLHSVIQVYCVNTNSKKNMMLETPFKVVAIATRKRTVREIAVPEKENLAIEPEP